MVADNEFSEYMDALTAQRGKAPILEEKLEPVKFENIYYDGFVFSTNDPPAPQAQNQEEKSTYILKDIC